jgi:hypothetical protein
MTGSRRVDDDAYERDEAQRRFEAALRGAGVAAALPMKDIPRKRRSKEARGPERDPNPKR